MRKILVRLALLAVVLALGGVLARRVRSALVPRHVALTAEERAWLKRNPEKLTLYFNTEFPPIEFADGAGEFTGLGADVVAKIEKRLGVTFHKIPCSDWNKHLAALASGECAIAPTIVRNKERDGYAFFTAPYATVPVVIITRREIDRNLTLDDLMGRRIAVVSGFATEQYLRDQSRGRFVIMAARNVAAGLRDVSFGLADAFLENLAVAAYHIEAEGVPNLRVAGSTDYSFAWSIGVSRKYPLLFSAIQKALAAIPPGELAAARKNWVALETPGRISPKVMRRLQAAALFVLLLVFSLAGITLLLKRRLNQKVVSLRESQRALMAQAERLELALREKETLLRELYHRTKNNMQVIRSLLVLRAANAGDSETARVLREMEARVQTMALVHQKLYQTKDLSRIDLPDYVRDLVELLRQCQKATDGAIKFNLDVAPLNVLIDIAIPLGLILNELISNSFKYAFPGNRAGVISISIRKPDLAIIEMRYSDDGVGTPSDFDFRARKTLGLQSIFAIAELQLQGQVTFASADPGLACVIRFADTTYAARV